MSKNHGRVDIVHRYKHELITTSIAPRSSLLPDVVAHCSLPTTLDIDTDALQNPKQIAETSSPTDNFAEEAAGQQP